jgi:hypothetical protein
MVKHTLELFACHRKLASDELGVAIDGDGPQEDDNLFSATTCPE